eukprot:4308941-Pleurochrysis_carterae.AAC.1
MHLSHMRSTCWAGTCGNTAEGQAVGQVVDETRGVTLVPSVVCARRGVGVAVKADVGAHAAQQRKVLSNEDVKVRLWVKEDDAPQDDTLRRSGRFQRCWGRRSRRFRRCSVVDTATATMSTTAAATIVRRGFVWLRGAARRGEEEVAGV